MDDRAIEAIENLTAAVTELAVKVKRLTNSPITPEKYNYIKKVRNDDTSNTV